ncbi:MAG: GNAT family N-acetyltransferase [Filifactoraceae bacterium]
MKCWGERVSLRSMTLSDVSLMCNWDEGSDILFADYNFPKMTFSEQKDWFNLKNNLRSKCFVIENRDNQVIGYIAMKQIDKFLKSAELGIVISPTKVGFGYGTEAIKVFMNWYFTVYKFKRLWLRVGAYNRRAINSYKSLGFVFRKKYYGKFYNDKVNPIDEREFEEYKDFFRMRFCKLQALYYMMECKKN